MGLTQAKHKSESDIELSIQNNDIKKGVPRNRHLAYPKLV